MEEVARDPARSPNNETNYANVGAALINLNRLDEAETVYKQAEERKLEGEQLLAGRYSLAFLKGDAAQMAQVAAAAMGKPGIEDFMLATQADTEAWYGKLKNARELTRQAMDSAEHNDAKETAAAYQAAAALREVESGNREQARADADAAVKLAPNRDVREMAAVALGPGGGYGRGGEAGCRTRHDIPAGHAGPEILAANYPSSSRIRAQRSQTGSRTIEGGQRDRAGRTHDS